MMVQQTAVLPDRIASRRPKTLPVGYHLTHFQEMLDCMEQVYAHVLDDAERLWMADFRMLDPSAQSLLVRMSNRKGTVFRKEQLRYDDVDDQAVRVDELVTAGFVDFLNQDDFADALAVHTKDDLFDLLLEAHAEEGVRRSWARSKIEEAVRARLEFHDCFGDARRAEFVVQRRIEPLRYFLYLYFGRIEESLTRFALRDLGLMRSNGVKGTFEARFETRREATESFFFAGKLARFDSRDAA